MRPLSIATRLSFAARAFAGIFSEGIARSSAGMLVDKLLPRANPPPRGTFEWLRFIKRNPLLRLAVYRIVEGLAAVRWRVMAPTNKGAIRDVMALRYEPNHQVRFDATAELMRGQEMEEVLDHPLTRILERNMGWFLPGGTLRKLTWVHHETVGEGFWLLGRNRAGVPVDALLIPPSWVVDTPSIAHPRFKLSQRLLQEEIPVEDMLWFRDADPEEPYQRGVGAAQALGAELESMEHAGEMIRRFFYNDARPSMVISGSNFKRAERQQLERQWLAKTRGLRKAYTPFFMEAPENLEIKELMTGFRDMQMVELMDWEWKFVRQYWGIPPSIIGDFDDNSGLGRSGVELEEMIFARWVLVPRLEASRIVLQEFCEREYDERLLVVYDNPVNEDKEFRLRAMQAQPAAYQVDEWRSVGGHRELDDEAQGKAYVVPTSVEIRADLTPDDLAPAPPPAEPDDEDE